MKKLKEILGKFFTIVAFIIFTIAWSLFVYVLEGEWLYFIPLIVGDVLSVSYTHLTLPTIYSV